MCTCPHFSQWSQAAGWVSQARLRLRLVLKSISRCRCSCVCSLRRADSAACAFACCLCRASLDFSASACRFLRASAAARFCACARACCSRAAASAPLLHAALVVVSEPSQASPSASQSFPFPVILETFCSALWPQCPVSSHPWRDSQHRSLPRLFSVPFLFPATTLPASLTAVPWK